MANLSDLEGIIVPWYVKYWRQITGVGLIVVVIGYVGYLHHEVTVLHKDVKTAQDTLATKTAEYNVDIAHFRSTVQDQNAAIVKYNTNIGKAKDIVVAANTNAAVVRATADEQVRQILSQRKQVTCEQAIHILVDGVPQLQWAQIK